MDIDMQTDKLEHIFALQAAFDMLVGRKAEKQDARKALEVKIV